VPEDKPKIKELLKKPWNPYVLRHSSLTEKSKILKEHILRQHAGWSIGSQMPQKYLHYFGNESNTSILEAYGIVTPGQKKTNSNQNNVLTVMREINLIQSSVLNAEWY
jgi:hypothetical protein